MPLNRAEAIDFMIHEPYKLGHLLGFTKLTELHNAWMRDMIVGKEDTTLQAHRGSYKTTCVSIALSVILILFPREKTLFMRKTDTDIKEIVGQVQKILQTPTMHYLSSCVYGIPVKLLVDNSVEVSTNFGAFDPRGTSQLIGMGIGSSLTGKHFDRIFTDDIVNVKDRTSKAERDRTKLAYQELQNVKNRGGRIYNTGTPWHQEDAFSIMPEARMYDCYSTGLISAEELDDIRGKMTASLFAANYELRHIASDDVIFTAPQTGGDAAMVEQGISHVDAAYGGEDFTAFTICRKVGDIYYLLGKMWRKHVDDCEDDIVKLHHEYMCGKIYCEDNGDKGYLAKELKRRGMRTVTYHEDMNKFLKITSYLKAEWKNVIFVAGTDEEYIRQICDYNENAEHDDAPDSAASVIRKLWNKKEKGEFVWH